MTTTHQIYEGMQRIAPLELAESWDNPRLAGGLRRAGGKKVLVTLDITPEVVEEAAAKGCSLIVAHHPVIFSPLKKLGSRDVPFQLVQSGISAICMHTNLDAAEGGVNEVLAGIFGMRNWETFAGGCGRVGEIDPITVPQLAKKAPAGAGQAVQSARRGSGCSGEVHRQRDAGAAAGRHQRRGRQPVRGCHRDGRRLSADRRSQPPPRL